MRGFVSPLNKPKVCTRCKELKPPTSFYKNGKKLQSRCKPCHNIVSNELRNPILRGLSEARRSLRRGSRSHYKRDRQKISEYRRQWEIKNPEKMKAHRIVHRSIKRGDLIRPNICEKCGKSGRIEASHTDYSKPLWVEWLCPKCHRRKDFGTWIHLITA